MLSREQQDIIENSIWVVNTALKKQGLQKNKDLKQDAILYMCQCIERFDPNKNIKWTTFAYKNVYLFIKRTHNKEKKKTSALISEDIHSVVKALELPLEVPETVSESKCAIDNIKAVCNPEECRVIELKLKGYKVCEISELMGCSQSKVSALMQSVKEKAKEIYL